MFAMLFPGIFLARIPDFLKDIIWFKTAKIEDVVKELDEYSQKPDVIAAIFFTFIDVKGQSNNNHAIFAMITFYSDCSYWYKHCVGQ